MGGNGFIWRIWGENSDPTPKVKNSTLFWNESAYGEWIHYVGTYDGTDLVLYRNGQEIQSRTAVGLDLVANSRPIVFASNRNPAHPGFEGDMDDARVYSRALSAAEVAELYQEIITDSSLVIHLPVDEASGTVAEDVSLFGNDGTYSGTSPVAGLFANARTFDGASDDIEATLSAQTPSLDGDITVSAWFKTDKLLQDMTGNPRAIAWKADQANYTGFALGAFTASSNLLSFEVLGENSGGVGQAISVGTTVLDVNQWIHVAGTWDGTTLSIYRDGVLANSNVFVGNALDPNALPVSFGEQLGTPGYEGDLDDLRIYRRALSASEISNIYNSSPFAKGLSLPWLSASVGGLTGSATGSTTSLEIDTKGTSHFDDGSSQFAYQSVAGDFELTGHVDSLDARANKALAGGGIMVRYDASDVNSEFVSLAFDLKGNRRSLSRLAPGGAVSVDVIAPGAVTPNTSSSYDYIRITRVGSIITLAYSADGVSFADDHSVDLGGSAPASLDVGFFMHGHGQDNYALGRFSEISLIETAPIVLGQN